MQSNQNGTVMTEPLPSWRCHRCRALLLRGILGSQSHIEILCRRCGVRNVVTTPQRTEPDRQAVEQHSGPVLLRRVGAAGDRGHGTYGVSATPAPPIVSGPTEKR